MAIVLMTKVANQLNAESDQFSFEYTDSLSSPGNGPWIMVPNGVDNISVTLSMSSGSGKVQTTTDTDSTVRIGSPVAVDWTYGMVSGTTEDACFPVTALRHVNETGTTKLTVRAQ